MPISFNVSRGRTGGERARVHPFWTEFFPRRCDTDGREMDELTDSFVLLVCSTESVRHYSSTEAKPDSYPWLRASWRV